MNGTRSKGVPLGKKKKKKTKYQCHLSDKAGNWWQHIRRMEKGGTGGSPLKSREKGGAFLVATGHSKSSTLQRRIGGFTTQKKKCSSAKKAEKVGEKRKVVATGANNNVLLGA